MLKCPGSHSNFCQMPNLFDGHVPNMEIFGISQQLWDLACIKILASPSHITGPAELNEIVQYCSQFLCWYILYLMTVKKIVITIFEPINLNLGTC